MVYTVHFPSFSLLPLLIPNLSSSALRVQAPKMFSHHTIHQEKTYKSPQNVFWTTLSFFKICTNWLAHKTHSILCLQPLRSSYTKVDNWTASPQNIFCITLSLFKIRRNGLAHFKHSMPCLLPLWRPLTKVDNWTASPQIFSAQHYPSPKFVEMNFHTSNILCLACCLYAVHLQKWTTGQQALKIFSAHYFPSPKYVQIDLHN